MRHWRLYRNLALIYAVALIFFVAEYYRRMQEDDVFLNADSKYTEVISQVYPQRNEPQFYAGYRAMANSHGVSPDKIRQDPEAAALALKDWQDELAAAAEHYQKSIDGGMISQEMLYYQYALTLMRLRADPSAIDQAITEWRRNYPFSRLRPLEYWRNTIDEGYEKMIRQLQEAQRQKELDRLREAREKTFQDRRPSDRTQP